MNEDLLERYLYAVTRRLPGKQREDVAQELRGLVDDMLSDRCGDITPTEKDLRADGIRNPSGIVRKVFRQRRKMPDRAALFQYI